MIYLIKFIIFLLISYNSYAYEGKKNEILFKINEKVFTNVDLEKRTKYIKLINNFNNSKLSEQDNKEIMDDYISSLIFYEYYIQNKIFFNNIDEEIEKIFIKNFNDKRNINETEIENLKININLDLIRNKIIEKKLNSKKSILLQEVNTLDLLYNYNLKYLIIEEKLLNEEIINSTKNRVDFNNLNKYLIDNKIKFFYKEDDINDNTIISNKIRNIIEKNISIHSYKNKGYITIISIIKNLESYEGVFVKLINFKTDKPMKEEDLECKNLNQNTDYNKTIYKEYEYSKLNNNIKNNLKSLNDYILFNNDNEYNYIVLCDLTYDEKLLKNINFNKNVNSQVNKIQNNFLKKYKNEYSFKKIK